MSDTGTNSISTPEHITCPKCNGSIAYYDTKNSSYYGCPHCYTFFKYEDDQAPEIIRTFDSDDVVSPALQLGATGTINNKQFIVVGIIVKTDTRNELDWVEYFLYQPDEAQYHILAETEGQWTHIWKAEHEAFHVMNTVETGYQYVAVEHDPYRRYVHYTGYKFDILYAVGEFDWNILEDIGTMDVDEFIDPPYMVVCENNSTDSEWYRGKNMSHTEVCRAFNLPGWDVPRTQGLSNVTESSDSSTWKPLVLFTLSMLVIVGITQLLISLNKPTRTIAEVSLNTRKDSASWGASPQVTGSYKINGPTAIGFDIKTDAYNEWVELQVTMVNDKTGKVYEFSKSIEYYAGYEGGESWSEGSQDATAVLSNIPSGTYHFNIYPAAETLRPVSIWVRIEENTTLVSNLVIIMLLLSVYPAIRGFIRYNSGNTN